MQRLRFDTLESRLPAYYALCQSLAQQIDAGEISDWAAFVPQVRAFFTPEQLKKVERIVPGWTEMASYANQQTLIHVTAVMVSLFRLPEYQNNTADYQRMAEWVVIFHDVCKKAGKDVRDHTHAFFSAAQMGAALKRAGFPVTYRYDDEAIQWAILVRAATTRDSMFGMTGEDIQDNAKLPEIIGGVHALFGEDTPSALVVKAVLFHMSITVVPDWPQKAPLTDRQIKRYIDQDLLPLLEIMMHVDNIAWNIFSPAILSSQRATTEKEFERIAELINEQT